MVRTYFYYFAGLIALLFISQLSISSARALTNEAEIHSDFDYSQHPSSLAKLHEAETRAIENNKQVLIILGAEWCHDSMALAEQFSQTSLREALLSQYEIVTVDVGYLEAGFGIIHEYHLPTFYGTPTTLIVEPESRQILNRIDFAQWANAASIKTEKYWSYFIEQDFPTLADYELSDEVQTQIDIFESRQGERVMHGFQVAGPLLRRYIESNREETTEFLPIWYELAEFRSSLPQMISEAIESNNQGSLVTPAPLSWELPEPSSH